MIFYNINGGDMKKPEVIKYPDGTMKIDVEIPELKKCDRIKFTWKFEREDEIILLTYIVRNLKERFYGMETELYMPYLPNARMDRVHNEYEVFTLKYFCDMINSLGFTRTAVLDVHSSVGIALLERGINIHPKKYIDKVKNMSGFDSENDYVFFPDEGSFKRYAELFSDCKHIGFGIKKRDWATGKILGLDICGESPEGRKVFITDDICSYGGTVFHSAGKLKELQCGDIDVFFTHCENSIEKGELLKGGLIHRIYTTNSICTLNETEKLIILNCLEEDC